MDYRESFVRRDQHRIHVREYPGQDPAIILMHGFPDNLHLYDRLYPYLSPPHRVIAFDFLGWGASDKPLGFPYTATSQVDDLDAVITQLRLQQVILVAHDASGPPAIDWALANSDRVAGLVLLNTYYCAMPTLRPPEAIWLFSTPVRQGHRAADIADVWSLDLPSHVSVAGREILQGRGGQGQVRAAAIAAVRCHAERLPRFFRLNEDLLRTIRSGTRQLPKLREFGPPVRIILGDADAYLNKGVAQRFHELFPASELFLFQVQGTLSRWMSLRRWRG